MLSVITHRSSDGKLMQEEQRRIINRESVRDEWLALMRDTSSAASNAFRHPAAAPAPGSARAGSNYAVPTAGREADADMRAYTARPQAPCSHAVLLGLWDVQSLTLRCRRRRSCERNPTCPRSRYSASASAGQLRALRAAVHLGGAAGACCSAVHRMLSVQVSAHL